MMLSCLPNCRWLHTTLFVSGQAGAEPEDLQCRRSNIQDQVFRTLQFGCIAACTSWRPPHKAFLPAASSAASRSTRGGCE